MTEVDDHDRDGLRGNVIWHVTMSLDGFIAGPDDTMDWVFEYDAGPDPIAEEAIRTTGAILAGRRWYDLAMSRLGGVEGIYGGAWTGPVFVITHHPPDAPQNPAITFLSAGIEDAVVTALGAAKGKNLVLFGATIPQQCLAAGLLDEIVIHLVPVLLGGGIRLYGGLGMGRVNLEPTHVGQSGQVTDLRFRVIK